MSPSDWILKDPFRNNKRSRGNPITKTPNENPKQNHMSHLTWHYPKNTIFPFFHINSPKIQNIKLIPSLHCMSKLQKFLHSFLIISQLTINQKSPCFPSTLFLHQLNPPLLFFISKKLIHTNLQSISHLTEIGLAFCYTKSLIPQYP